jgi:hypothetical protein
VPRVPEVRGRSWTGLKRAPACIVAIAVWLTLTPAGAAAQAAGPGAEPAQLLVGVEARLERIRYHFDNPSSADTSFPVPHFFEQQYVADNIWLMATARYTAAGIRWETSAGTATPRTVRADDYDTFFDPGDVVIVSGTTGDATSRAFVVSQRADVGRAGPLQVSVGYRLRWDRFDFGVGHKTVTRNGALVAVSDEASRETTDSQVHELFAGVRAARTIGGGWRIAVSGDVAPATLARLSVRLPDKYPGQDLVFLAKLAAASARVALVRPGQRWPIEIALETGQTWSYPAAARLSRPTQRVGLSVGRTW